MSEALPTVTNEEQIQLPTQEARFRALAAPSEGPGQQRPGSQGVRRQRRELPDRAELVEAHRLRPPDGHATDGRHPRKPSWSATFLIACINKCGRFASLQFRIEGEGMKRSCTAHAVELATGDVVEGPPVSIQMAHDEGWATKSGSKWKTMPDLMLRYRAAAFFARTIAPEVAMGLYCEDELRDVEAVSSGRTAVSAQEALEQARDVTPGPSRNRSPTWSTPRSSSRATAPPSSRP